MEILYDTLGGGNCILGCGNEQYTKMNTKINIKMNVKMNTNTLLLIFQVKSA